MKPNIIISPWSRKLRNGQENPKNYPFWNEVIKEIKDKVYIIQIGVEGEKELEGIDSKLFNLSLEDLKTLTKAKGIWISVDNFFPHFANTFGSYGIVIFSLSDPFIFGYKENVNLLKDRKYLREKQFDIWEAEKYNIEAYVDPKIVIETILNKI